MTVHSGGRTTLGPGDALIVVDMQNDFLPGGSLAVPRGDQVIGPLNEYMARFNRIGLPVIATRDWHPPDHCSFREQGGTWPPHCVRHTEGARFTPSLQLPPRAIVISKADKAEQDAYSGFQGTDLHQRLQDLGIRRLFVGGLATDYCVLNAVKDALSLGYMTFLLLDAVRAVDVTPGDGDRAVEEMAKAGALFTTLEDVE